MTRSKHVFGSVKLPILVATAIAAGVTFSVSGQSNTIPPDPTEKPNLPPPVVQPPVVLLERVYAGWSAFPPLAEATDVAIAENTIQMYQDANFRDDVRTIENVTSSAPGVAHKIEGMMEDSLSSVRWNLPPGIVVIMYEDDGGSGEQLTLWGKGEASAVGRWDFNDKASSWAWYYAGGNVRDSEAMRAGTTVRPHGTQPAAVAVPDGSIALFQNSDFKGDLAIISDFTAESSGELIKVPAGINDKTSSLRWNLPPGVVVMFHQDGSGRKQQAAIFGQGEVRSVDEWDLGGKISRWSWHYIGSRDADVLGYEPPRRDLPATDRRVTVVHRDAIDLVARDMTMPNKLEVRAAELVAKKNPTGEGTFVYVPRTRFEGVERQIVWVVVDDRAYAISGPAKMITPSLLSPKDVSEQIWSKTGLSQAHAEDDVAKIVFVD